MSKFFNSVVILMVILGSVGVRADGPGWTATSEVVEIVTVVNGGINVRLSPELNGCTSQSDMALISRLFILSIPD